MSRVRTILSHGKYMKVVGADTIRARWVPDVTRTDLPGDVSDGQCRYLEAAVNGALVASIYAPNGNPQPGAKFEYKLAWLKCLNPHG